MSEIPVRSPENVNQLQGNKFKLVILNIPHVVFFCSSATIPGISMIEQEIANPVNRFFVGGNKLQYDPITLNFRVDEDLKNYKEIFDWMVGITAPETTEQFREFVRGQNQRAGSSPYAIYSDATLFSLSNVSNVNVQIKFIRMFPTSLQGLDFNLENQDYLNASVTFRYDSYRIGVDR